MYLSQDMHALGLTEKNLWLVISGVNFSHPYVFSQLFSSVSVLKYSCSAF